MNYSLYIEFLICMVVYLPLCYRCDRDISLSSSFSWLNDERWHYMEGQIKIQTDLCNKIYELQKSQTQDVNYGSPSHGLLIDSQIYNENNLSLVLFNAEILLKITQNIVYTSNQSDMNQYAKDLSEVKLGNNSLGNSCLLQNDDETICKRLNLEYRQANGSCNSPINKSHGKSNTPYKRLLFADYENIISCIGTSPFDLVSKRPNPRKLSTSLVRDIDAADNMKTMAIAIWTIFIGHDLSHTAISNKLLSTASVECCQENGRVESPKKRNMFCAPIIIPEDDKFYSRLGRHCMNYARSAATIKSDCKFGTRDQLNQATHYLDASMIYGSSDKRTMSLRARSRGRLMTHINDKKEYIPLAFGPSFCHTTSGSCFSAGDGRVNSHPYLTAIHTVFLREHNRIADELYLLNKHWNDEKVFQETKKIVTAFIQHITYTEWLPALLGPNNLEISNKEWFETQKETHKEVDPRVHNGFATAILPFANSMFNDTISLYSEDREIVKNISLRIYYNRPTEIINDNNMDNLIRGLSMQNTQKVDMLFSESLTNYLYSNSTNPESYGMDIVSLTIQRSRDHGIPSYTQFRKYCHLKDIENAQDLAEVMVEGADHKLLEQYKMLDHIDLFVGALSEKHEEGSMVGPLTKCLIYDQFTRTRLADHHFYDLPGVFKKHQLHEIQKITLARILCDNSDNIVGMQKNVFMKTMTFNDFLHCKYQSIPKINLNLWAEKLDR